MKGQGQEKKKQLTENPFPGPGKAPTSFGSSSPSTVSGTKSGSRSKSIPALMKMIELWNPVPKGSTCSPTKGSFRDQQISELGLESQERQFVLN